MQAIATSPYEYDEQDLNLMAAHLSGLLRVGSRRWRAAESLWKLLTEPEQGKMAVALAKTGRLSRDAFWRDYVARIT